MHRRRRVVLAVIGVVVNLLGIAALSSPWLSPTFIHDTTTTMMWVEGAECPWTPWAWVALAIAGLATVVFALRSGGGGAG
jgi:hypothetical protein